MQYNVANMRFCREILKIGPMPEWQKFH